jgi:predicted transcriptional regulator
LKTETVRGTSTNAVPCGPVRRGRQDIIMGILRMAEYGSTRAKMIDKLKLSSAQCNRYLVDLKEAGYVAEVGRLWETTDKGRQIVDACRICHNLMSLTALPTR